MPPPTTVPIIDIFAGPGGLSEGFSSYRSDRIRFRVALSIEKDKYAHQTLELRALFRQFAGAVPDEYNRYLAGQISRNDLFELFPEQARAAKHEAWHATLGEVSQARLDRRIKERTKNFSHWVLIGGPPCQAYSVIGRSRMRGTDPKKFEKDERHFLYRHYLQILARHRPSVVVMENVKGILSSKIGDQLIFDRILTDLSDPVGALLQTGERKRRRGGPVNYHIYSFVKPDPSSDTLFPDTKARRLEPGDYVIEAEKFRIPQTRHRVILLGVRSDLEYGPFPRLKPEQTRLTIRNVIGDLPAIRSTLSREVDEADKWIDIIRQLRENGTLEGESDALTSLILEKLAILKPPKSDAGGPFIPGNFVPEFQSDWYAASHPGGISNHESKSHMNSDLHRYFFAACYADLNKVSPVLSQYPKDLLPNHKNVKEAITTGKFSDRFRVQLPDHPASTVTSHIAKDGHYYIHYDPLQCRSLSVREAARIQTFPDNYFFEGSKTEQYKQVGNAVPPLLANQIAEVLAHILIQCIHGQEKTRIAALKAHRNGHDLLKHTQEVSQAELPT